MFKGKVFVLSLHRSGTRSTHHLLTDRGYSGLHWAGPHVEEASFADATPAECAERLQPLVEAHDVLSDVPFNVLFREYDALYPGSSFVMLVRPVTEWIASVREHTKDRPLDPFELMQYRPYVDAERATLAEYDDAALAQIWRRHGEAVRAHFAGRDCLLEAALDDAAGPAIARFLDLDPQARLPRLS